MTVKEFFDKCDICCYRVRIYEFITEPGRKSRTATIYEDDTTNTNGFRCVDFDNIPPDIMKLEISSFDVVYKEVVRNGSIIVMLELEIEVEPINRGWEIIDNS